MTPRSGRLLAASLTLALGSPSAAQDEAAVPPPQFEALAACRAIEDVAAKAACYDAATDALLADVSDGDLVAVERTEIVRAEREGLGLPSFPVPGLGRMAADESEGPVLIRIASFDRLPDGRMAFKTEDDQRWTQSGSDRVRGLPEPPFEAELRPAFGDTWFLSFGDRPAIRVQRER